MVRFSIRLLLYTATRDTCYFSLLKIILMPCLSWSVHVLSED